MISIFEYNKMTNEIMTIDILLFTKIYVSINYFLQAYILIFSASS